MPNTKTKLLKFLRRVDHVDKVPVMPAVEVSGGYLHVIKD